MDTLLNEKRTCHRKSLCVHNYIHVCKHRWQFAMHGCHYLDSQGEKYMRQKERRKTEIERRSIFSKKKTIKFNFLVLLELLNSTILSLQKRT